MERSIDDLLVKGLKKEHALVFAREAIADESFYLDLMKEIQKGQTTQAMKAAWILGTATSLNKALATVHQNKIVSLLANARIGGVQRELLKAMYGVQLNSDMEGKLLNLCFTFLVDADSDIAIKHHCVRQIQRQLKKYPELENEFRHALEIQKDQHTDPWRKYVTKILDAKPKMKR